MSHFEVVLRPDRNVAESWADAPSVIRSDDGRFYVAAHMREGDSRRGRRGYKVRILESADGHDYRPIHHVHRDDVGVPVFERPCLVQVPKTGQYLLHGCTGRGHGWSALLSMRSCCALVGSGTCS